MQAAIQITIPSENMKLALRGGKAREKVVVVFSQVWLIKKVARYFFDQSQIAKNP